MGKHNGGSHLGLYCLHQKMKWEYKFTSDDPKNESGLTQMTMMDNFTSGLARILTIFQQIQKHQLVMPILNVMFPILSADDDDDDEEEEDVESQKPAQLAAQVRGFTR